MTRDIENLMIYRKSLHLTCLLLSISFLLSAEQAVLQEQNAGEGKKFILENRFLRAVFSAQNGGKCNELFFKPAKKHLVDRDQGWLLGSRIWNYADDDLYFQWQKGAWESEVQRAQGEVALVLRSKGKVGFTRSTTFEKRIALRDGESMLHVTHSFHVGQELMVPQKIGLWFSHRCGATGEPNRYYFPLDDGIVSLDPATGPNQVFFYNPSRGWAGFVGKSRTGLCFNMEFRRLMCFYQWSGTPPTFEWAFRSADIKNGDSLRTEEKIIAFTGLPRINGSGSGVAAGLDTPDKCSLDEAKKGFQVSVAMASGRKTNGNVEVSVRRLPDGKARSVLKQEAELSAGETRSLPFKLAFDEEGTWEIRGTLNSGNDTELMEFAGAVTVGKASAPIRIRPREVRIGRKSERFEDRVPPRGTAPKDLTLRTDIETPHVPWARPYSGGKLRVLVLTSSLTGREAVEMSQRLDMEIIWVTAGSQYELNSFSYLFNRKTFLVAHTNHYIEEKLKQPVDAILIGGLRGDLFTDKVIDLLRKRIEEGAGLVYAGPNRCPDKLQDLLPVRKEKHLRYRNGQWQKAGKHYITSGVPFEVLPKTDYVFFEAKTDQIASIEGRPLVVASEGPGKGRVVVLGYNTSWQGAGSYKCGITPWLEKPAQRFPYWEYHFSLLAKSLVWAAKKESSFELLNIVANQQKGEAQLSLDLNNLAEPLEADFEIRAGDAWGRELHRTTQKRNVAKGANSFAFSLSNTLAGGLNLIDVVVRTEGKSMVWGTAHIHIKRSARILDLTFDRKIYRPLERAKLEVGIETGADPKDLKLTADFTDSLGRHLRREIQAVKAAFKGMTSFEFPIGSPIATELKARVTLSDGDELLAVAETDAIMLPEKFANRKWSDWESAVWGGAAGAYEREYLVPYRARLLKQYGITAVLASANWTYEREYHDAVRAGFQIMPMSVAYGAINIGHRAPKGKLSFQEARAEYQKTHERKFLARPICLNDPNDLRPSAQKLEKLANFCGELAPIGYNLGDEMSTTHYVSPFDYDFGETCLAAFRKWLQPRHKNLDALNEAWGTKFEKWEDVAPMTAYEVKGRGNYAPWAEHRAFMDETFARYFEWVRKTLRKGDPNATVGLSGSQAAEAYGGYNWPRLIQSLDFMQSYDHHNTGDMHRSFRAQIPRLPWYGYMTRDPRSRGRLWMRLFNGNQGGSFFKEISMFFPDGHPHPATAEAATVTAELQNGTAALIRRLKSVHSIGIHYSQASIRAAFISGEAARFRNNRMGWVKAFEDIGFQCEFLDRARIEKGELARRGYKAFVLPYSVAISDGEARAFADFVKSGGLLLADGKTGLMDGLCRTRNTAPLDGLFGIAREKIDPLVPLVDGEALYLRDSGNCTVKGLRFDVSAAEPHLRAAASLGRLSQSPLGAVGSSGKGKAVLVNHFFNSYGRRQQLGIEKPMRNLVRNLLKLRDIEPAVKIKPSKDPDALFYVAQFKQGAAQYVGVVNRDTDAAGNQAAGYSIEFPVESYVFNVRTGKRHGRKRAITDRLEPGDAALYALLPYDIGRFSLALSHPNIQPGDTMRYDLNFQAAEGESGLHVFRIEVIAPDGKLLPHYGSILPAENGKASGSIPMALNDPKGRWQVRARDVATNQQAIVEFRVEE